MLKLMEQFRIAQYGLMQSVALVYGILACGTAVKIGKPIVERGLPMPSIYWLAAFYRDYGFCLFLLIIAWALFAAYHASIFSKKHVDEGWVVGSGMCLLIVFFILGSWLAFGAGGAAIATPL